MYAPTTIKPLPTAAQASAGPAPGARHGWHAAAAVAATALVGLWAVVAWSGPASTLPEDVQAFQQRVTAGSDTPADASASTVLAQRYLSALTPAQRARIAAQVRAEQDAGLTPAGNDAYVLRRLALYEEALQQAAVR